MNVFLPIKWYWDTGTGYRLKRSSASRSTTEAVQPSSSESVKNSISSTPADSPMQYSSKPSIFISLSLLPEMGSVIPHFTNERITVSFSQRKVSCHTLPTCYSLYKILATSLKSCKSISQSESTTTPINKSIHLWVSLPVNWYKSSSKSVSNLFHQSACDQSIYLHYELHTVVNCK